MHKEARSTPELGKLITGEAHRDAIHVAVAPVVAAETVYPGQRVGLNAEGKATTHGPPTGHVGIVDPFLTHAAHEGDRCWLFLFPGTITGIRHEWEHPAFAAAPEEKRDSAVVEMSKAWLRDAAAQLEVSYERLVGADSELVNGDFIIVEHGTEHHRDVWYSLRDEFWKHRLIVTGEEVPENKRGGFSCSC